MRTEGTLHTNAGKQHETETVPKETLASKFYTIQEQATNLQDDFRELKRSAAANDISKADYLSAVAELADEMDGVLLELYTFQQENNSTNEANDRLYAAAARICEGFNPDDFGETSFNHDADLYPTDPQLEAICKLDDNTPEGRSTHRIAMMKEALRRDPTTLLETITNILEQQGRTIEMQSQIKGFIEQEGVDIKAKLKFFKEQFQKQKERLVSERQKHEDNEIEVDIYTQEKYRHIDNEITPLLEGLFDILIEAGDTASSRIQVEKIVPGAIHSVIAEAEELTEGMDWTELIDDDTQKNILRFGRSEAINKMRKNPESYIDAIDKVIDEALHVV